MRSSDFKNKLIEFITETPLVSFACKKTGIARATFYRWRKDDLNFREKVDKAISYGSEHVSDLCEASLIKGIHRGDFKFIKFWLEHNNVKYRPLRPYYTPPMLEKLKPGQTCNQCGSTVPGGTYLMDADIERIEKIFAFKKNDDNKELTTVNKKVIKTKDGRKIILREEQA